MRIILTNFETGGRAVCCQNTPTHTHMNNANVFTGNNTEIVWEELGVVQNTKSRPASTTVCIGFNFFF